MSHILVYDKTLVQKQDLGLYSGDIAIIPDALKGHPKLNWSGSLIDIDQFRIALAFLKWTHDEHHVEGQIRLFYNEFTREWKAVALPQYIWSAGHTREVEENDPVKSSIIEDLLNSNFGQAGTGHHHSGMSAFQSGGDKEDELGQNGFHFTVGQMGNPVADFHCRATFRKINYDPGQGMLDPNQWLPGLHNGFIQEREIAALWLDLKNLPPFPAEWKTYLRKKPEEVNQWQGYGFNRQPAITGTTTTPREDQMEMFREGYVVIYFKPCVPTIHYRFCITPKPVPTTPATAAAITKPITPAATTSPVAPLTQAEINQKKLDELEQQKTQDQSDYDNLVKRVATMSENEFDDFCQNLRDAGKKFLATQLPVNDLTTSRGRVLDRLEEVLAEFRDSAVPDRGSALDLQNVFDALQDLSCRIVKDVEAVNRLHSGYLNHPHLVKGLKEILLNWGTCLFERILTQGAEDEWTVICEECSKPASIAVNFYDTMLVGLERGVILETIDNVYDVDGTLFANSHSGDI